MAILDNIDSGWLSRFLQSRFAELLNDNGQQYNQPAPPLDASGLGPYLASRFGALGNNQDQYFGAYGQPNAQRQTTPDIQAPTAPEQYTRGTVPDILAPVTMDMAARGKTPAQPVPPQVQTQVPPQPQTQVQPQAQAQEPSFFDRLGAFGDNLATSPSLLGGIAAGVHGAKVGMTTTQENQLLTAKALYGALTNSGMDPAQAAGVARAAAIDPKLAETLIPKAMGLDINTIEGLAARKALQGGAKGGDVGSALNMLEEFNRRKAAATKLGELQGGNQAAILGKLSGLDYAIQKIDELRADPNLPRIAGNPVVAKNPGFTGPQKATIARFDQLKGTIIADALQAVHGLGLSRPTQNEVFALRDGFARLDRAQDIKSLNTALDDLRGRLSTLRYNAGIEAGLGATPGSAAPSNGVVDYRTYFGGK